MGSEGVGGAWSNSRIPKSLAPAHRRQRSPLEHSPVPVRTFTFCVLPWARATWLSRDSMSSQA